MNFNVFPMDKSILIDDNILLFLKTTELTIHTRVFIQIVLKHYITYQQEAFLLVLDPYKSGS